MSLRLRLAVGLGLAVAISLGTLGVVVERSTKADLLRTTHRLLRSALENRIALAEPARRRSQLPDPRRLATAHLAYDPDGALLAQEPAGPPTAPLPLPDVSAGQLDRLRRGETVTVAAVDGSLRYLVLGRQLPDGRTEVEAAPLEAVDATIDHLVRTLALGSGATLLAVVLVALAGLRRGLRPLDDVVRTADAVTDGERGLRITTDRGPAEIRHLATALDCMLQQQNAALAAKEASEQRVRRFLADAAHELQTPITSVLGWAELQRRGALDDDGRRTAAERIEAESTRLARLVDEMLLLARLDEHRPLERRPVGLTAVVHDAVTDARAAGSEHPISFDAPVSVQVTGDSERLRQLVDNLLRNVRVHTPAGTRAAVAVTVEDGFATVSVEDDGPGFGPGQLDHAFERFWRSDASRTRATGGSGLGLSIVAGIVDAHGGSVVAANRPAGGASFTVRLPLDAT